MFTTFRLPPFVLDSLAAPLLRHARDVAPSQELHNGVDVYLRRWYLERSPEKGNVYLHQTLRSDSDEEHHDHPWENLSIWLQGTGMEQETDAEGRIVVVERPPGTVVYRPATSTHRMLIGEPTWTLFLTGPKIREWGFVHEAGWMHNQDHFALRGYS